MKKIFILSFLVVSCLAFSITSKALETNANDYEVVETPQEQANEVIIYETDIIKIVKQSGKYGIFDKNTGKYLIKPVLDDITKLTKNNDFEYKIKSADMIGYMNLNTKDTFLSYFDDISVLNDKYLKIKKDGKYGIADKKGNVIIPSAYDRVLISSQNGNNYLIGKLQDKYYAFNQDGSAVAIADLYNVEKDINTKNDRVETSDNVNNNSLYSSSIMQDLNPVLKRYLDSLRKQQKEIEQTYISENPQTVEDTVIEEMPVPPNKREGNRIEKAPVRTSIVSTNLWDESNDNKFSYANNITKLSVTHEDYSKMGEAIKTVPINDRAYYIVSVNGKLGLQTKHGREIIPAKYDVLKVKEVNSHEVVAAISRNESKLYDTNGDVLAKRFHNKINVYTSMRKYDYIPEDNFYNISFNDKRVGEIEVFKDGNYEYKRVGFNLSNMKRANEIFAALITAEK